MESYSDENLGEKYDYQARTNANRRSGNLNLRFQPKAEVHYNQEATPPNGQKKEKLKREVGTISKDEIQSVLSDAYLKIKGLVSAVYLKIQELVSAVYLKIQELKQVFLAERNRRCWTLLFFVVLEVASLVLDLVGKNKRRFLLTSFLLSAFGFAFTLHLYIKKGSHLAATKTRADIQLEVTEIVFSVVQLILTLIFFIRAVSGVKIPNIPSVFPLVFSIIRLVFVLPENTDSPRQTDNNSSRMNPIINVPSNDRRSYSFPSKTMNLRSKSKAAGKAFFELANKISNYDFSKLQRRY